MEGVAPSDEFDDDLHEDFQAAADFLASAVISKDPRFTDKLKLQFYGLYKQATAGKCNAGRPGFWDLAGRAKWDAWASLADLPKADAMQQYMAILSQVAPGWDAGTSSDKPATKTGMGPVFSCLAGQEDSLADTGPSTLHELAGQGDVETVERLLAAGTPVDCRDDMGCTPLHFAADRGSTAALSVLLSAGADVNARDDEGQTPLHYAAVTEHREVYDLLLAAGGDPSVQDSQGATPAASAPASWGLG